MYPVNLYYKEYPDLIRFYLNENSMKTNSRLKKDKLFDIKSFLFSKGIDYR